MVALMVSSNGHLAMLFPGQGSQTADMREAVERHRADLVELARSEVSDDLFERAADGTAWAQPAIFCAARPGYEMRKSLDGVEAEAPLAMEAANA
jgi:[acyl-carrier-protein] S-malonyltransferase